MWCGIPCSKQCYVQYRTKNMCRQAHNIQGKLFKYCLHLENMSGLNSLHISSVWWHHRSQSQLHGLMPNKQSDHTYYPVKTLGSKGGWLIINWGTASNCLCWPHRGLCCPAQVPPDSWQLFLMAKSSWAPNGNSRYTRSVLGCQDRSRCVSLPKPCLGEACVSLLLCSAQPSIPSPEPADWCPESSSRWRPFLLWTTFKYGSFWRHPLKDLVWNA